MSDIDGLPYRFPYAFAESEDELSEMELTTDDRSKPATIEDLQAGTYSLDNAPPRGRGECGTASDAEYAPRGSGVGEDADESSD